MALGTLVGLGFSVFTLSSFTLPSPSAALLLILFAFLIASWQEENIYRGYLFSSLTDFVSQRKANLIQATLFSILHLGWKLPGVYGSWNSFIMYLLWAGGVGCVLGWLRYRFDNIVAPFLAHGLINVFAFT